MKKIILFFLMMLCMVGVVMILTFGTLYYCGPYFAGHPVVMFAGLAVIFAGYITALALPNLEN